MGTFFSSLLPVALLILGGYLLARKQFIAASAWSGIEKLTYYIFFPALLIRTLGDQSLQTVHWPGVFVVVTVTLLLVASVLLIFHRLKPVLANDVFTSVFQGGVRFNTYIALSVAEALYGTEGLAMASLAAGLMIVLINMMCISVLLVWGRHARVGLKPFVQGVIANPLIIACLLGWLINLGGIHLPAVVDDSLQIIGRAALPLGLLAVGVALRPELVHGHRMAISIASLLQFLFKPLIAVLLVSVTDLDGVAAAAVLLCFMVPTATSSYILAKQLGGDSEAMASIITFQTLLAFIVMPLWAVLLL